jgi:hypothetical protein
MLTKKKLLNVYNYHICHTKTTVSFCWPISNQFKINKTYNKQIIDNLSISTLRLGDTQNNTIYLAQNLYSIKNVYTLIE